MDIDLELYKYIDITKEKVLFMQKNSKILKNYSGEFISSLNKEEKEYIYIFEDNIGFSKIGKYPIDINFNNIYTIDFIGSSENLQVELFIISYSQDKKLAVESIGLNRKIEIYPHEEAKSIRLAIRVLGSGKFNIESIKIYKRKKIEFMSYKDINILGFDKSQNIKDLRVAAILDEFTMNCYKDMVDIIEITPYKWKLELSIKKPQILLVESAWQGNGGLWNKKISSRDEYNLRILKELTLWCRENNIPTVFWNKEDPVHFDAFILACTYFDYIFTTDEGVIQKYKDILKNNNVYALPFAAQPKIHNPIKKFEKRIEKACFAGTYYGGRFKEREIDTNNILRASINTIGLDIYDRQYLSKYSIYKFPKEYEQHIKGGLKADELDIVNKGYKIMLNVNSVKNSDTMFSRRVFESLASLTPVVSSYSSGIKKIFNDLIVSSDDINELQKELNKLNYDSDYYYRKAIKGMRLCMNYHTYQDRFHYIIDKVGIDIKQQHKKVSLICIVDDDISIDNIINNYDKQIYENKELILLFKEKYLFNKYKKLNRKDVIYIFLKNYLNLKDILKSDYLAVLNPNNYYGKYYIQDLINATKYCHAEFIGKKSYYKGKKLNIFSNEKNLVVENNNEEFEYVDSLDLDKCIVKISVFQNITIEDFIKFTNINNIDKFKYGYRYFSIDKYNLIEGFKNLTEIHINTIEI